VRTTAVKDRLLEVNEEVDWYPDHIKHGRYGDWLENNVDWALSRERLLGHAAADLALRERPRHRDRLALRAVRSARAATVTGIDPHRPAIDEVSFACPECEEDARRVPEVIDTWYDSGAMPYAQWGYHPELGRGPGGLRRRFPADFIAEAIDQTRGWFYTLMAEGVLLFDSTAYRTVVCLGTWSTRRVARCPSHSATTVRRRSRSWTARARTRLRWYMLTGGSPWAARRVGMEVFDDAVRRFLLPLWNVYAFFVTYANASGFDPQDAPDVASSTRPILDRWVLSQLARTEAVAREGLDAYDATAAGRRIAAFVEDLSNWYVRRARRRFWDPGGEPGADAGAAFLTLHECLVSLAGCSHPSPHSWPRPCGATWQPDATAPRNRCTCRSIPRQTQADRRRARPGDGRRPSDRGARPPDPDRDARPGSASRSPRPSCTTPAIIGRSNRSWDLVAEELNVKRVVFAESAEQLGGGGSSRTSRRSGRAWDHECNGSRQSSRTTTARGPQRSLGARR
jgi:isoleucyl-tRNA synthetase